MLFYSLAYFFAKQQQILSGIESRHYLLFYRLATVYFKKLLHSNESFYENVILAQNKIWVAKPTADLNVLEKRTDHSILMMSFMRHFLGLLFR